MASLTSRGVNRDTPARQIYRHGKQVWAFCTDCGKCVKTTGISRRGWHHCMKGWRRVISYTATPTRR